MTPLRGLVACSAAFFLLALVVALLPSPNSYDGPTKTGESRSMRRLRSFFNINGPDAFFPPSAIISLTNDNSTFFVARPATYGPSLPERGLTGLLRIASGFGEESTASRYLVSHGGEELGCSDIPGWPSSGRQQHSGTHRGASRPTGDSQQQDDYSTESSTFKRRDTQDGYNPKQAPGPADGTDDHLHWPLAPTSIALAPEQLGNHVNGPSSLVADDSSDTSFLRESAEIAGKVVLLSRGGCGFLEKTKWVQRRGGAALIVGNNIRDSTLISMYASEDTSDITIPSIFTSYVSARLLSSLLPAEDSWTDAPNPRIGHSKSANHNDKDMPPLLPPILEAPEPQDGLWVTITPTTLSPGPFLDTLLVLVISPLVTLTVVYALLLLRTRIQRRRWRAPKALVERLPVRVYHTMSSPAGASTFTPTTDAASATTPLLQPNPPQAYSPARSQSQPSTDNNDASPPALERQRAVIASRVEKQKFYGTHLECVVCLEEYVDGESQVMSLPCGHEFHADCITPWLTTRRRTCPICKGDVVRSLADDLDSDPRNSAIADGGERGVENYASSSRMQSNSNAEADVERAQTPVDWPQAQAWRSWSRWWNGDRGSQQTAHLSSPT